MTERPIPLAELAQFVGGQVQGDATTLIRGAAVLRDVQPGDITLVDQPERVKELAATQAAAVVVAAGIEHGWPAAIIVADVHQAFAKIVAHFRPPRRLPKIGVSPLAVISPSARLGSDVDIHPGATIGDEVQVGDGTTVLPGTHLLAGCRIGRDVLIGPAAVLYEDTVVGDRTMIHGGAVIGTHGFGYQQVDGRHVLGPQLGHVEIGCDVEIGAGTTIDRGTYGPTTIGDGTKIDNLVQIAHNCRIGRHNMICSQVGIAGSTTTGDYVVMGGQAGVRDHVRIGHRAMLSAMAGVTNDVPDGAVMMGIPATPVRLQRLKQAALSKLPDMRREFKALRREIAELEKTVASAADQHSSDRAA
jgi:UDP-3-O-[3-hydroxymyristoyl] glucosamine N-acyltransferase